MKNLKKRWDLKGELTTKQLVTLVILIVSFIIILFLIFRLNLGETTDKEICHNSVVLQGQSKIASGPLDCKINYICISGGGDCQGFPATDKAKVNPKNEIEIMKAIADEMADCWWQFGEGKINYGSGAISGHVDYAICSITAFDKKIQEKVSEISYSEFYNFLKTSKKGDSTESYLQYLYGVDDISSIPAQEQIKVSIFQDKILTAGKYSVITGIDNNIVDIIDDDEILFVYIVPTAETQARTTSGSKEFITKA
ncbi:MAG: hypothetical protein AABW93_03860 [Nanoarchaeota archaeon]